ncbi:3607_t:CDS:10 [Ambispora leptoticha]|uniref:3607_t:CDS:1 n=1 Tax=Ambispora leptoticha TaxID=144679 RepID=A0A9N8V8R0_9GLOM|nr:3607_t:CDS:10 [Ambispora leptoticha]
MSHGRVVLSSALELGKRGAENSHEQPKISAQAEDSKGMVVIVVEEMVIVVVEGMVIVVAAEKNPSVPMPISRPSSPSPFHTTGIIISDDDDESDLALSVAGIVPLDCPVIINDVVRLQLGPLPQKESRWFVIDVDVSEKWHLFKETWPRRKHLQREEIVRDTAVSELQTLTVGRAYEERAVIKTVMKIVPRVTLKSSVGEIELCTTYIDPVLGPVFADPDRGVFLRSNKEAPESKNRKLTGRSKQPDAFLKLRNGGSHWIHPIRYSPQGYGEAKVQEEMDNLYSLCTDLVRVAVFNKDAIDFYNKNCMLGFQGGISHFTSPLLYDGLYVMVEAGHIDVPMSLEQLPAFIDTLLVVSNALWTNCDTSRPAAEMEPNKRNTKL